MTWEIEVFFDGDCPLCIREINMLRWLDKKNKIKFTDIAGPDFADQRGSDAWRALMDRIHGKLSDGTMIEGVEVFRRLYAAVGFGWIVKVTRWPGISHLLDWGYRIFAKNRLKWTGRCDDSCKL
jgi:predicted DCC family thiol-disulfide oxidoreductase YuxK